MNICALILTRNEALHIERCIRSVRMHVDDVFVVDCGSDDATVELASVNGATVLSRSWKGYSDQLAWAINNVVAAYDWCLRIDADEYLNEQSNCRTLRSYVNELSPSISGVYVQRGFRYLGRQLHFGGVGKRHVLRLFRPKVTEVDGRLMDEHLIAKGVTIKSKIRITDDNLKGLNFFFEKHLKYSDLEVSQVVSMYGEAGTPEKLQTESNRKRIIYYRQTPVLRAILLFFYRYILQLGFLDGGPGFLFHFYQCLWYRLVIDTKLVYGQNGPKATSYIGDNMFKDPS